MQIDNFSCWIIYLYYYIIVYLYICLDFVSKEIIENNFNVNKGNVWKHWAEAFQDAVSLSKLYWSIYLYYLYY